MKAFFILSGLNVYLFKNTYFVPDKGNIGFPNLANHYVR